MPKTIVLRLATIHYTGTSIGDDIRIEVDVLGGTMTLEVKLKTGKSANPNVLIGTLVMGEKILTIPATIRVIEQDVLFPDKGSTKIILIINPSESFPQKSVHTVDVRESRGFLTKKTARFEITIEASIVQKSKDTISFKDKSIEWWEQWKDLKPYSNRGVNGKEDYNRHDTLIRKIVAEWNKKFCDDQFPPDEPLDPNLVKAILYQESRVGYYPETGFNVMQVGNTGDPSLKTLQGKLKEYWVYHGKERQLKYPNAKITTSEESIKWGTRWLYHKAYENFGDRRKWIPWQDAVRGYGPPKKSYGESVWSIYTKGIKKEKKTVIRLWSISIFLIPFLMMAYQGSIPSIKKVIMHEMSEDQRMQIEDIEVRQSAESAPYFYSITEWSKDWWESLRVGKREGSVITWLPFDHEPTEQSILKARFIKLEGFDHPILEVYGETHVGNGAFYVYEVRDTEVKLLLRAPAAVDYYPDGAQNPENIKQYGYMACGEVFESDALKSEYRDMNTDGAPDIRLSGVTDVLCEEPTNFEGDVVKNWRQIKVTSWSVERVFLWQSELQQFREEKNG